MSAYLVRSYTEAGYRGIPPVRLSGKAYGESLQCLVPACADTVLVDRARRVIYLARRAAKPMTGWWWIGGRMIAHETKEEAAARNFQRETGLAIARDRLQLAAILDYRWKDRAQAPEDIGCHMLVYTFTAELTDDEMGAVAANLVEEEYEASAGLTGFSREQLVEAKVFPAIIDLYDHIFPAQEQVECGTLSLVSSDVRRDIREFEFDGSAFQDFVIRNASKPLGQHYHEKKSETFYILEGGGTIRTARVDAEGKIVGEVKRFEVAVGSVIRIPPYTTHRFDLIPNTRLVAFSSEPFDAGDLIACPIE